MRTLCVLLVTIVNLNACTGRKTESAAADSTATQANDAGLSASQCYQQVTGRDTTTLQLTINGSDVTGELLVLPYEKDQARGSIKGTMVNKTIKADWQRSGEGVTQPYLIDFEMQGDSIMWREGERVEEGGKWVLKAPDQGYRYVLTKTDCR
ncbi:hypothetical protein [Spirosoma sp. 209]|uniref:hypothetical protein n=1 Tax=Spirosoma sp. 209 TaxID=1955701 RepID=UPI00098D09F9|nr:hypothetical protein [Spirosoma sp. 209]